MVDVRVPILAQGRELSAKRTQHARRPHEESRRSAGDRRSRSARCATGRGQRRREHDRDQRTQRWRRMPREPRAAPRASAGTADGGFGSATQLVDDDRENGGGRNGEDGADQPHELGAHQQRHHDGPGLTPTLLHDLGDQDVRLELVQDQAQMPTESASFLTRSWRRQSRRRRR